MGAAGGCLRGLQAAHLSRPATAEPTLLAVLEPYSSIGREMFVFQPGASLSPACRRNLQAKLFRLPRAGFDDLMARNPVITSRTGRKQIGGLAERMRHMDDWVVELSQARRSTRARVERTASPRVRRLEAVMRRNSQPLRDFSVGAVFHHLRRKKELAMVHLRTCTVVMANGSLLHDVVARAELPPGLMEQLLKTQRVPLRIDKVTATESDASGVQHFVCDATILAVERSKAGRLPDQKIQFASYYVPPEVSKRGFVGPKSRRCWRPPGTGPSISIRAGRNGPAIGRHFTDEAL